MNLSGGTLRCPHSTRNEISSFENIGQSKKLLAGGGRGAEGIAYGIIIDVYKLHHFSESAAVESNVVGSLFARARSQKERNQLLQII
jgi:hypothetical protein